MDAEFKKRASDGPAPPEQLLILAELRARTIDVLGSIPPFMLGQLDRIETLSQRVNELPVSGSPNPGLLAARSTLAHAADAVRQLLNLFESLPATPNSPNRMLEAEAVGRVLFNSPPHQPVALTEALDALRIIPPDSQFIQLLAGALQPHLLVASARTAFNYAADIPTETLCNVIAHLVDAWKDRNVPPIHALHGLSVALKRREDRGAVVDTVEQKLSQTLMVMVNNLEVPASLLKRVSSLVTTLLPNTRELLDTPLANAYRRALGPTSTPKEIWTAIDPLPDAILEQLGDLIARVAIEGTKRQAQVANGYFEFIPNVAMAAEAGRAAAVYLAERLPSMSGLELDRTATIVGNIGRHGTTAGAEPPLQALTEPLIAKTVDPQIGVAATAWRAIVGGARVLDQHRLVDHIGSVLADPKNETMVRWALAVTSVLGEEQTARLVPLVASLVGIQVEERNGNVQVSGGPALERPHMVQGVVTALKAIAPSHPATNLALILAPSVSE
jgi:hypothetical protein